MSGPDGSHDDLPAADEGTVDTDGGVSAFTGEPFVTVRTGGATSWQWTCEEARAFAVLLIRTAAAAEADADLVAQLQGMDVDQHAVGAFVTQMRDRRAERP